MPRTSRWSTRTIGRTPSTSRTIWRLRQGDERSLQRSLGELGLSSLGRCEPHVLATVESVRSALDGSTSVPVPPLLSFEEGRAALDRNTDALFGPRPRGRVPRVMVTLPSEAATDYLLVRHLVSSGMDVARINGAHDGPDGGRRWPATSARPRSRSAVRAGSPWTCPDRRCAPDHSSRAPRVVRVRPERDLRGVAGRARDREAGQWRRRRRGTTTRRSRSTANGSNGGGRATWSTWSTPGARPGICGGRLRARASRPPRSGTPPTWRRGRGSTCDGDTTAVGDPPCGPPAPPVVRRGPAVPDGRARARGAVAPRPARHGPDRLPTARRLRRRPAGPTCRPGRRQAHGGRGQCRARRDRRAHTDGLGARVEAAGREGHQPARDRSSGRRRDRRRPPPPPGGRRARGHGRAVVPPPRTRRGHHSGVPPPCRRGGPRPRS